MPEIADKLGTVALGADHVRERLLSWARVSKRPSADRDPRLESAFLVFESCKAAIQRGSIRVHRRYLEARSVEETEGEVDMREAIKVEIFWRDGAGFA